MELPASPLDAPYLHSFLLRLQHAEHPSEDWEWLLEAIPDTGRDEAEPHSEQEQFIGELCPTAADAARLVHALCAAIGREDTLLAALQVTGTLMGTEAFCRRCPGCSLPIAGPCG